MFTITRANRVCKSFSLSLSVYQLNCLRISKGLCLGELIRLQRIYFSKHFRHLFWTLTCKIWMKLTRTDVVFSRNAMMLFIVQKTKLLRMTWKSTEKSFGKYKKYWQKMKARGPTPCLVGRLTLHRPQLQLHIFRFAEKKSERKFHCILRYGAAAKP